MSEPTPDPAWLVLAIPVLLAGIAVFWLAVHLRGRIVRELADRVDLAITGLAERALEQFRSLQSELNRLLPAGGEPFDPSSVVLDPAKLVVPARRGLKIVRRHSAAARQYRNLLIVCSVAKYVSGGFCLVLLGTVVAYYLAFGSTLLWNVLLCLSITALATGVVLMGIYATLTTKVEGAIERSRPGPGASEVGA